MEDDYLFRIFSQILNCIDGNSWKPDKICKHTVVKSLESLAKPFFIEKIFQWFFIPVESKCVHLICTVHILANGTYLHIGMWPVGFLFLILVAAGSSSGSISVSYTFHEEKVCRFLGETLLKSMGKFNMKEFLTVWQESVPEGNINNGSLNGYTPKFPKAPKICIFNFLVNTDKQSFTHNFQV